MECPVRWVDSGVRDLVICEAVETSKRQPLLANVQALRAIAAALVVLVHMTLKNVGVEDVVGRSEASWLTPFHFIGIFGVDLFFVISGFIMLATNWDSFGRKHAGFTFLIRRAIRIYPPYWFATLPVFAVFEFARERFMVSHMTGQTGILESFLLLPNPHRFILTVGWTLVWEMIFYIVFAAILPFRQRYVPMLLALWFGVELVLNGVFAHADNFYLGFASATLPIEFIFGTAIGWLYIKRRLPPTWLTAIGALVTTSIAFKIMIASADDNFPIDRVWFFGIPAALIVVTAIASEVRGSFVAPRFVSNLGDGSYAVYLWHISILVCIRQILIAFHPAGPIAHAVVIVTTLVAIVAIGQLIFLYFERPVTAYLNARYQAYRRRARIERAPVLNRTETELGPTKLRRPSAKELLHDTMTD